MLSFECAHQRYFFSSNKWVQGRFQSLRQIIDFGRVRLPQIWYQITSPKSYLQSCFLSLTQLYVSAIGFRGVKRVKFLERLSSFLPHKLQLPLWNPIYNRHLTWDRPAASICSFFSVGLTDRFNSGNVAIKKDLWKHFLFVCLCLIFFKVATGGQCAVCWVGCFLRWIGGIDHTRGGD